MEIIRIFERHENEGDIPFLKRIRKNIRKKTQEVKMNSSVLEKEEQKALVTRCEMEGIYIVSTENSLQFPINAVLDILKPFLKINQIEIIKKKLQLLMSQLTNKRYSQGMKKGYPDLFLPEYKLYIELKRRDGGVVSAEQLACHEKLRSFGYRVEVCHGAAEAWKVICECKNEVK